VPKARIALGAIAIQMGAALPPVERDQAQKRNFLLMTSLLSALIHPHERVGLFIDGANLYSAAKALGFDMDYKNLLSEFRRHGLFVRANYYTALLEDQDFSPIRPLVDWLDYNGYTVVTKSAREFTDATGRRRIKGDMDVEITVDLMEAASHLQHVVLFSGDGDFVAVVEALQRKGVRVTVESTLRSQPPMVADDLRRQADTFLDLTELASLIGRAPRERPARYEEEDEDEQD